ncbi:MAG TPA: 2-hydroxyacid dehydrogenase [Pseudomonas sp.]
MGKPSILLLSRFPDEFCDLLREHFDCYEYAQLDNNHLLALAPRLRGIVASGESSVTRALIAGLPALEIISVLGVGYDGIDIEAAREHAVCVTHTPGLSTDDIADFAMALLLSAARQVVAADKFVRRGDWAVGRYPVTPRVFGGRIGIVGLGRIGRAVAVRALAFGMSVAYTSRTPKTDIPYYWYDNARELAANVDFLVVCASGGSTSRALIDDAVLAALGPSGVLINVARGSIVDEDALVQALYERKILAAGIDVFCNEPHIPEALFSLDNVVLTPHMASTTGATLRAMLDLTFDNLAAHFSGQPVLTPIE